MNIDAQIVEIVRILSTTRNVALVSKVMKMIEEARKNEIVGYEPGGKPITQVSLVESIIKSDVEIDQGKTWRGEDLINHFEDQAKHG